MKRYTIVLKTPAGIFDVLVRHFSLAGAERFARVAWGRRVQEVRRGP